MLEARYRAKDASVISRTSLKELIENLSSNVFLRNREVS